jgi:hypothetical protein
VLTTQIVLSDHFVQNAAGVFSVLDDAKASCPTSKSFGEYISQRNQVNQRCLIQLRDQGYFSGLMTPFACEGPRDTNHFVRSLETCMERAQFEGGDMAWINLAYYCRKINISHLGTTSGETSQRMSASTRTNTPSETLWGLERMSAGCHHRVQHVHIRAPHRIPHRTFKGCLASVTTEA